MRTRILTTQAGAIAVASALAASAALWACGGCINILPDGGDSTGKDVVVLAYNDLGMHCMSEDFSEMAILPPFNTLHAQVIERGGEHPRILIQDVMVNYSIPGNTRSSSKTNFWEYAEALFGAALEDDVGLAGKGLSGTMVRTGDNDWFAPGIPLTPINDVGQEDAYQLASVTVVRSGANVAQTQAVVPVSWEIDCGLCHDTSGISVSADILRDHDRMHGTTLEQEMPVLCARCHADPALALDGDPAVSTLSHAMHGSHAAYLEALDLENPCYACHPGERTQCLRDVHFSHGMTCVDCHTSMEAVADANRTPWVDLPRCEDCHSRSGFTFEQSGTLYRNSVGHGNVRCAACHGSPHAVAPTEVEADNVQAIALQGHAGTIDTCTVCHTSRPDESFFHRRGEGD